MCSMLVFCVYVHACTHRAPAKKFEDRVYIPQDDHPETNFVGLIIGPRYC